MVFFPPEKPEENLFIVHKAITDLSLQETSVDEMTFREGERNFHFVHRDCLTEYGWQFCMGGCVSMMLKKQSKQCLQKLKAAIGR